MKNFEYHTESFEDYPTEEEMNNRGEEGWEIISIEQRKPFDGSRDNFVVVMKREREGDEEN